MRKNAKIDVEKALDLRLNHRLSNAQIAEYFGVQPHAVSQRLKAFMENLPTVQELHTLDSERLTLLRATYHANLSQLSDPAKLKEASLNNVAYSTAQLHNQIRLEEGKSTANVNMVEYFSRLRTATQPDSSASDTDPPTEVTPLLPTSTDTPTP